jgi:hypothetical protein
MLMQRNSIEALASHVRGLFFIGPEEQMALLKKRR